MHHFTDRETETLKSDVLFLREDGAIAKKTPSPTACVLPGVFSAQCLGDKHFNFLVISAGRMGMSKVGSIQAELLRSFLKVCNHQIPPSPRNVVSSLIFSIKFLKSNRTTTR